MPIKKEIEEWEKEFLIPYCFDECQSSCCDKHYNKILVTEDQLDDLFEIIEGRVVNPPKVEIEKRENGEEMYWVPTYVDRMYPHCPAYDPIAKRCKIQHNKPKMCKGYPIKIDLQEKIVRLHSACDICRTQSEVFGKLISICNRNSFSLYIRDRKITAD